MVNIYRFNFNISGSNIAGSFISVTYDNQAKNNEKDENCPDNDADQKNDVEEESAVKIELPSCLSYEDKRHLKLT